MKHTSKQPPEPDDTRQPPSLWRHADFMKLWAGQTISRLGGALSGLAVPLIAAASLQASPAQMGVLAASGSLASLVVGLFAGVWVDHYRRRTLLIAGDVGRALLFATIAAAAFLDMLSMIQLYLVGFIGGIFTVFFDVASRSYLPTVVERSQLVEANSKLELSGSITAVSGPSLAGLVIQAITAPVAIVLDAFSYLVSAGLVAMIRVPEAPPRPSSLPLLTQVRQGLGVVIQNPILRAFAGCLGTSNFTSSMFFALYILFGTRELGMNAAQLGLVYGIGASGAIVGAILGPKAARRLGVGRASILGALLGSIEVVPVVFATPELAVPLLLLSSFTGNLGWVLYNINEVSLRQAITPAQLLGRTNATLSFLVAGMIPLGFLAGGALGEVIGMRTTIALAALGSMASTMWLLFSPVRGIFRIPETVEEG